MRFTVEAHWSIITIMMPHQIRYPCALTIAGSDSGGGAGLQADLKTFAAHGVYGASVITAVTAQNTCGVRAVHPLPPAIVAAQLAAVLEDMPIAAVKVGMLATAPIVATVAEQLRRYPTPHLVLDTVMLSTSGPRLIDAEGVTAMREHLFPLATVITPNLPEAACLLGRETIEDPITAARLLLDSGARAVLLKGGHGAGDELIDVLVTRDSSAPTLFRHPRLATPHTHGTGCTLSAALAAGLAHGLPLHTVVEAAIHWIEQAIAQAWTPGRGPGSLHHFWQYWPSASTLYLTDQPELDI